MIKKLLAFYFSLLTFSFSLAQSWEPLGEGLQGGGDNLQPVYALCSYNGKLYAGGVITQAGNIKVRGIACWDGNRWDSLRTSINGYVEAMFVYRNQLCVGGSFTKAGKKRVNYLARWIDTAGTVPDWYNLGATFVTLHMEKFTCLSPVKAFAEYNDQLYVSGDFGPGGCAINHVGVLKDGKWTTLSSPKCSVNGDTSKADYSSFTDYTDKGLAVYNDKLCATGAIVDQNGTGAISKAEDVATWDSKKSSVGFLPSKNPTNNPFRTYCFAVYNSQLYAGGSFVSASNKPAKHIAVWDGDHWSPLLSGVNGEVNTMLVYEGKLYVGGAFDSAGGNPAHAIAVWDGHTWSAVGDGFTNEGHVARVRALAIYNGELYAGGYFTSSGDKPVMNIARLKLGSAPIRKNKNG
jgi:hypothetical protein